MYKKVEGKWVEQSKDSAGSLAVLLNSRHACTVGLRLCISRANADGGSLISLPP